MVLKEANDPGGGGWDLREFLREGGRAPTWNNVARWTKWLSALPEVVPWAELEAMNRDARRHTLRVVAAVNLNKVPGGSTANFAEIQRFAATTLSSFSGNLTSTSRTTLSGAATMSQKFSSGRVRTVPRLGGHIKRDLTRELRRGKILLLLASERPIAANLLHYGLINAVLDVGSLG